jgi:hypothetical protein
LPFVLIHRDLQIFHPIVGTDSICAANRATPKSIPTFYYKFQIPNYPLLNINYKFIIPQDLKNGLRTAIGISAKKRGRLLLFQANRCLTSEARSFDLRLEKSEVFWRKEIPQAMSKLSLVF